jgi:predicted transcriptional regulator
MDYIKVKDNDHLVRDVYSNAIVNVDMDAYNAYVENYKQRYNETQRIENLEGDVSEIKNDLNEIKNLLRSLVNGSN